MMKQKLTLVMVTWCAWISLEASAAAPNAPEPFLSSKPFLRDVTTGYLLDCFFLSPKPYCWEKDECLLSGWEVDRSGGHFEFQPNCHYPEGFGFHSDWFKLVDTSTNGAITIAHQFARQSEGQLTLEFRFRLPTQMDGACWQLRDLERAAVSLMIDKGNLCVAAGVANRLRLRTIDPGHDYGVRVVADLNTKSADILIDGVERAHAVPFAYPVGTLDYFLVKTGDATTGEMFLNPVTIYKGYAVNERFLTCAPGRVPSGWDVAGRAVVEQLECGTKPDIFSLRVTGQASKRFVPQNGRTVSECRFLLPGAQRNWRVELWGGGSMAVALDPTQGYRSNLWHLVKMIADPVSRTVDVYHNGKLATAKAPLQGKVTFFDTVRFVGNMWVDDVQVYPWRDYPADYVPEPKPCPSKSPYLLGVQSCNLWREGKAYAGWEYVLPYRNQREPYLGWYDEGNPEETDWEIKWQVEHGIGFEMHCWYRPNNAINHPIKDGVLDQGIIQGLFNARYGQLARFAIMCTDEGACETNPQDWHENIIPYWIEYFFKDPRYLKIEGKPVVSIYHLGNLQRMFGGKKGAQKAIQTLRDDVAKAGFPGVIVLMEDRSADLATLKVMKEIGADYCYAYTWATKDTDVQRKQNVAQRSATAAAGLGMLPSLSMGWDRAAWGVHDGGWVAIPDYRALLTWAKDDFMPTLPENSLGRRMVMLANWNEFGEGHFLLPNSSAGFGYLDALRDVFAAGGPHEDAKPSDRQKRRFTVLFPRD